MNQPGQGLIMDKNKDIASTDTASVDVSHKPDEHQRDTNIESLDHLCALLARIVQRQAMRH